MLGTIFVNVYEIKRGLDGGTNMGYLDGSFDMYNDGKLEVLLHG